MGKANEIINLVEQNFKLYDKPGKDLANAEIANALEKLAGETSDKIERILDSYVGMGASDTESRASAYSYFIKKIKGK